MLRKDAEVKKENKDAVALQNAIAVTKKVIEAKKQQSTQSQSEMFLEKIRNHQTDWTQGYVRKLQQGPLPSKLENGKPLTIVDENFDEEKIEIRVRR